VRIGLIGPQHWTAARLGTTGSVARHGSFCRAAEELSLTRPAVSQQILSLERQLGIRLIDRGPGGLGLTAAGALLLGHADAVSGRLRWPTEQLGALWPSSADGWQSGLPERHRDDRAGGPRADEGR
jgi:hypothetical protein